VCCYRENKFLFNILIVCCLLCGCYTIQQSQRLKGVWHFKDRSLGPLTLTFLGDGTFEVDANADGNKDIWGRYKLLDNRVQLTDEEPRVTTECYEPGFHYFMIKNGVLKFELLADQCKPRKYILNLPMVKKIN